MNKLEECRLDRNGERTSPCFHRGSCTVFDTVRADVANYKGGKLDFNSICGGNGKHRQWPMS